MIRRKNEVVSERHDHKFGGEGYIVVDSLITSDKEFNGKGRAFCHTTLQPGCEIGFHQHHGESEIYYFLTGEGKFNDDGSIVDISAGDVTFTFDGQGHGVKNTGNVPMEIIAVILYA
ncbi:MAG: cupin domain-containing protein [Sphaerochaetaceae bacterium]|nr:cupin domain-containing protein [Sphaerochaetaceae bacterium]